LCGGGWQAAGKYDELKTGGSPEFNVFFRKVGATDFLLFPLNIWWLLFVSGPW